MPDGGKCEAKAKVGDNLLDVIIENDVDIDGYGQWPGLDTGTRLSVNMSNEI